MKRTQIWTIDSGEADAGHPAIQEAGRLLREGELVAFPTETVYGLGANAKSSSAVAGIYAAKGRPSDNPLIVHIADRSQLDELVSDAMPQAERMLAERLIARFWPGPLTLVLPVRPGVVSTRVTAELATVAVRMPDHPLALALIRAAGCPVAAPSANRSGRPSPTTARHVEQDLAGRIAGIIDGGPTEVGLESTVVAVVPGGLELLRPGGVTAHELREAAPDAPLALAPELAAASAASMHTAPVNSTAAESKPGEAPRSPGMKYAHYAPQGEMRVIIGDSGSGYGSVSESRSGTGTRSGSESVTGLNEAVVTRAADLLAEAKRQGKRTGVLTYAEHTDRYSGVDHIAVCGSLSDLRTVAHQLYDALRSFDEADVEFIVAEGCPSDGVGEAIMNRLLKAAAHRVERV